MALVKVVSSNLGLLVLIVISFTLPVKCKVFTHCELGITLIENGIQESEVGKWICLANSVSRLNSTKITGQTSKGYGIFQISNYWYCWDEEKPKNNDCKLNCTDLADDDVSDDIKCASLIKRRQGFSGWTPYKQHCENKSLESYTSGCDFTHGIGMPPTIKNLMTNLTFHLKSTDAQIVCESEGTLPIKLKWLKFGKEVDPSQYTGETAAEDLSQNLTSLTIKFDSIVEDTEGVYTCEASNYYGSARKSFNVLVIRETVSPGENNNEKSSVQDASSSLSNWISKISIIPMILFKTFLFQL